MTPDEDLNQIDTDTYRRLISTAPRRTMADYQTNPGEPLKQYLDMKVAFFGLCSYQPVAWKEVFRSIRAHYPSASDSPVYLVIDGGMHANDYHEMAAELSCEVMERAIQTCLYFVEPELAVEFLDRMYEICTKLTAEGINWLVNLHPDVICEDRISKHPHAPIAGVSAGGHYGLSGNMFPPSVVDWIRSRQPGVEINGFGWCGGGIVHVPTFLKVHAQFHSVSQLLPLREELKARDAAYLLQVEDCMMPLLFNLCGYPYRVWLDNAECHRGNYGLMDAAAFVHGFKGHYVLASQTETVAEYYRRSKQENADRAALNKDTKTA